MKKLLIIVLIGLGLYHWLDATPTKTPPVQNSAPVQQAKLQAIQKNTSENSAIKQAFINQQSKVQVQGSGSVIRVLADDNKGSRHQRFILQLADGQTLLIAHNIDLAPRINGLAKGDTVQFYGQYEWNNKGGVVHWTHHDPQGRHVGGWLKHKGSIYQ
ncbi:DUF3465 domain-containing protein [Rheinheimera sp. MMS21-TC3]|uniref:DUF3465 domain-containing protein n=1 Tax=Rheinheimera sp. MMS21-TC3 TaxID=3072790 RepID=UPI0028C4455A|nr:DUF3465 domain-containing protein [Rheinheimera sp. MMS21-TC3]WNO61732.1 DUF3465 domain-containing protein [Rheinheimera sp. MMS21-TC3]